MQTLLPCALAFSVALLILAVVLQAIGRGFAIPPEADLRGVKSPGVAVELGFGLMRSGLTLKAVLTVMSAALGGAPVLFMSGTRAKWMFPLGLLTGLEGDGGRA
ncbi:MAG TPA: hypothetical protein VHR45_13860 [Thermoanaerobaculia bacterium]|nr:hypothetical protein [Thermoanaerobaculia bacterium]